MMIPPTWILPDALRVRLGTTTYGRQRALAEEGHLLLVLHKLPSADDPKREGVLFWRSPSGDWQFNRGGPGPGALKRHVQTYADAEAQLTTDFDQAADLSALFNILEALTPLVRAARNMHAAIQAAREATPGEPALIEARDNAYEVERKLELLLEDVRNDVHYRTARQAEDQAKFSQAELHASHRLNMMAALFLPLTALSGLFGMNFAHGLDERSPTLFWLLFVCGVGLGLGLQRWVAVAATTAAKPAAHPKRRATG